MMGSQQDEAGAGCTPWAGLRELLERAQQLLLEGSTEAAAGCLAEAVAHLRALTETGDAADSDPGGEPRRRLAEGLQECRALVLRARALLEQEQQIRLEHWRPQMQRSGYAAGAGQAAHGGRELRPHLVRVIG